MKVVINKCYGGFSLSPLAVKRMAELQGKECYFYAGSFGNYKQASLKEAEKAFLFFAFDVPNVTNEQMNDNEFYGEHELDNRPNDRSDKFLVQVVEELGEKANGSCAELKVVEIPDGIDYEIEEYDGMEWISEAHRTWR